MVRKGKLAVFESSNISENGEATPTKIDVYACYIYTYLHNFFEPVLKGSNVSKNRRGHAFSLLCINFLSPFYSLAKEILVKFEGQRKGRKSLKLERPYPPNLVYM